ncbi:MAG: LPXTG cell wall anchor domain-containing protein [Propionibacteriaceae bacterium]|nr:LPXTG cell wall anchor domain-containing protein [Propionibacteriaceae bacterium]
MSDNAKSQQRRVMMQAPVKALDPDGRLVLIIGTACFAAASVVCGILYEALAATGQLWRLWVVLLGTALGLIALWLTFRKRRRHPVAVDSNAAGEEAPHQES